MAIDGTQAAIEQLARRIRHLETLEVPDIYPLVWNIPSPAIGVTAQMRLPWDCTVTRIDASTVDGTSVQFNVQERLAPDIAGPDILAADLTANSAGASVTGGFGNAALASGSYLAVVISAVTGAVGWLNITLTPKK